jgi:hypothetical protein
MSLRTGLRPVAEPTPWPVKLRLRRRATVVGRARPRRPPRTRRTARGIDGDGRPRAGRGNDSGHDDGNGVSEGPGAPRRCAPPPDADEDGDEKQPASTRAPDHRTSHRRVEANDHQNPQQKHGLVVGPERVDGEAFDGTRCGVDHPVTHRHDRPTTRKDRRGRFACGESPHGRKDSRRRTALAGTTIRANGDRVRTGARVRSVDRSFVGAIVEHQTHGSIVRVPHACGARFRGGVLRNGRPLGSCSAPGCGVANGESTCKRGSVRPEGRGGHPSLRST